MTREEAKPLIRCPICGEWNDMHGCVPGDRGSICYNVESLRTQLAASQAECERLRRENLELLGVCPDCKESLYWCECTKHGGSLSHDEV